MNIGWGDQPPVTTLSIHLHSLGLQLVTWGVDAVVTPGAGYYSKVRARTLNRREAGAAPASADGGGDRTRDADRRVARAHGGTLATEKRS